MRIVTVITREHSSHISLKRLGTVDFMEGYINRLWSKNDTGETHKT